MIVLHLIPHLIKGGAERQLLYLTTHFARIGREVHIAYLADTPIPDELARSDVHLHPIAHSGNYDPMLFLRLVRLIRRIKPDVIQTWLLQMDVLGGLAALLTNTPWLLREPINGLYWTSGMKTWMRRWIGSRADAVVSNSNGGDAYWAGIKPAVQRFVISNTVPFDAISATPVAPEGLLGFSDNRPIVMAAGRLDEQKNFEVMIRGFAKVISQTSVGAVIFGEGPLRGHLENVIRECGMEGKILLPGVVPSIWGALKSAAVFVSMSRYEGHPNVVLEAIACGCPLVVSDIPSHREILDDETAVLIERYEDPNALAEAVLSVLGNADAALARSRTARAQLDARYRITTICQKYEAVYETIVTRRGRRNLSGA